MPLVIVGSPEAAGSGPLSFGLPAAVDGFDGGLVVLLMLDGVITVLLAGYLRRTGSRGSWLAADQRGSSTADPLYSLRSLSVDHSNHERRVVRATFRRR